MSYHFIDISETGAVVSVKDRQLVCKAKDGIQRSVPLEDVGAVMVTSFSAILHNSFLVEAAKNHVAVILCERFKPVSILLPVIRGSDTLLTRAQAAATLRFRETLWRKTIDAKLANQFAHLEKLSADEELLRDFRLRAKRDDPAREGNCARLYWSAVTAHFGDDKFRRCQDGDGINSLLNYAYGVLLTRILQKMLLVGLDPMFGVGHAIRERAAPLAYDLMEPFRPIFDQCVVDWVGKHMPDEHGFTADSEFKRAALSVIQRHAPSKDGLTLTIDHAMDRLVEGLREAFLTGKTTAYKPWTQKSSKWDG